MPVGLSLDSYSGEIKVTTTAITDSTPITITRSNPGYGTFTITLQVVDTSATMVFGQYGSFTCASTYNTGACAISAVASNQNLSSPYGVVTDSNGAVYISGVNRVQYYPPNINISSRVYGQPDFTMEEVVMQESLDLKVYIPLLEFFSTNPANYT
nr:hypothetical protein [Leptospira bandrabouensis]